MATSLMMLGVIFEYNMTNIYDNFNLLSPDLSGFNLYNSHFTFYQQIDYLDGIDLLITQYSELI